MTASSVNRTSKEQVSRACGTQALAELAVDEQRWEDAQQLVAGHPELAETVCVPWAEWLVARGSFHEARLAYRCLVTSALLTLLHSEPACLPAVP